LIQHGKAFPEFDFDLNLHLFQHHATASIFCLSTNAAVSEIPVGAA
jgi:hypothetical protein